MTTITKDQQDVLDGARETAKIAEALIARGGKNPTKTMMSEYTKAEASLSNIIQLMQAMFTGHTQKDEFIDPMLLVLKLLRSMISLLELDTSMDDSGFPPADHTPTDVVDHMADPSSTALSEQRFRMLLQRVNATPDHVMINKKTWDVFHRPELIDYMGPKELEDVHDDLDEIIKVAGACAAAVFEEIVDRVGP